MQHLVFGASGQVGGAIVRELGAVGEAVAGTRYTGSDARYLRVDMTQENSVSEAFASVNPDIVWVPAALPNVDWCEEHPDDSWAVNVEGPVRVMEQARRDSLPLIFFSTDYVFDGTHGPYLETDAVHPLQTYGQHKVEAEQRLLHYDGTVVVRPAWIYSAEPMPRNFVFRVLQDLKHGRPIRALADQMNTPTPAAPMVRQAWQAVQDGFRGILHLAGPERLSRLELVRRIAQLSGHDPAVVQSVGSHELSLPARRPLDGGLATLFPRYAIQDRLEDLDFSKLMQPS